MKKIRKLSGDGKKIGVDPKTGKEILLKIGRYGRYLEIENEDKKAKRTSIPKKIEK